MRHLSFSGEEILETISMVRADQFDIRTITIGISLFDCASDSAETLCRNIFAKVTRVARELRHVSAAISFHALSERLTRKGQELSVRVEIQREEIFKAMHRV